METTNRVLMYLQPTCNCHEVARRRERLHKVCEAIEAAAGDAIIFWEPDAATLLESGEDTELEFLLEVKAEPCTISDDIALHTITELRRVASTLAEAADRLRP